MTGVQTCALPICFPVTIRADHDFDQRKAALFVRVHREVTRLQDSIERLTNAQEQKTAAEYFYTQAQEKKIWEEIREQIVKSDVAEETKEAMITKTALENFNLMQAGIEPITRQKLNSEQINYLKGQLAIGWANVAIGEKSDRKSTRLNSSHRSLSRMPSSA